MIPHIIHYCWFGREKKPPKIQKYIDGWHNLLPDYRFIEWNEDNFPVDYCEYTKEAYEIKKYAFVSDVARLFGLYKYGGIYLDTDVEILKRFDQYLDSAEMILARESGKLLMTAFIAVSEKNDDIKALLDEYATRKFMNDNGTINQVANTVYLTEYMKAQGLELGKRQQILDRSINVYDYTIFGAFNADESIYEITEKTVLIHHCLASWGTPLFRISLSSKKWLAEKWGGTGSSGNCSKRTSGLIQTEHCEYRHTWFRSGGVCIE